MPNVELYLPVSPSWSSRKISLRLWYWRPLSSEAQCCNPTLPHGGGRTGRICLASFEKLLCDSEQCYRIHWTNGFSSKLSLTRGINKTVLESDCTLNINLFQFFCLYENGLPSLQIGLECPHLYHQQRHAFCQAHQGPLRNQARLSESHQHQPILRPIITDNLC